MDSMIKPYQLLHADTWHARVFSGPWETTSRLADVVEPATGHLLGRIGIADSMQVETSCAAASMAQSVEEAKL